MTSLSNIEGEICQISMVMDIEKLIMSAYNLLLIAKNNSR